MSAGGVPLVSIRAVEPHPREGATVHGEWKIADEPGKVIATITTSVDGFFTGPDDGPGCGLGVGGERLHYWVIGWAVDL